MTDRAARTAPTLTVATYNIHKGVQGIAPLLRLEIHNLQRAVQLLGADVICLQEVRKHNRQGERRFANWPRQGQAEFLAPPGWHAVYVTNAITRHGEHGNALLTRWPVLYHHHEDMSDHRLEQRGLLHVCLDWRGQPLHVIVVHLGLIAGSRIRQTQQLLRYIQRSIPPADLLVVAGDFNDWNYRLPSLMQQADLHSEYGQSVHRTFPARLPLMQLDHIYARGLQRSQQYIPGAEGVLRALGVRSWGRLSDHLPLVAQFHVSQTRVPPVAGQGAC